MNEIEAEITKLLRQNYPLVVRREGTGYFACIPTLGILVVAESADECFLELERRKRMLFEEFVKHGFGGAMLLASDGKSVGSGWRRIGIALTALSLVLLTILIPVNYLLAQIPQRIPSYVESAMDVVQRRLQQMPEADRQRISVFATRICPAIDEMVEARCKADVMSDSPVLGRRSR